MERELVALRGIIEQVGAAPRVIADDGEQIVLPATPNASRRRACALWHPDQTRRDDGGRGRQARYCLRPTQRLGGASRAYAAVDGAIPAVREYPLMADSGSRRQHVLRPQCAESENQPLTFESGSGLHSYSLRGVADPLGGSAITTGRGHAASRWTVGHQPRQRLPVGQLLRPALLGLGEVDDRR